VCGEAAAPGASRASTACEFVRLDEPSWDKVWALGPDRGPGLDRVGEVVVVVSANAGLAVTARIVMKRRYDFMFTSNLDMHHNQSVLAGVFQGLAQFDVRAAPQTTTNPHTTSNEYGLAPSLQRR
jgi:hypothetical protein